jgi:hypothetical protein
MTHKGVLYAGGHFDNAGKNTLVNNVAQFDGELWIGLDDRIAQWQGPARIVYMSNFPAILTPYAKTPLWTSM